VETFVIRVWIPAEPETDARLRGFVEHVGLAAETPFATAEQLVAAIEQGLLRNAGGDDPTAMNRERGGR
jgi:hypothetical protein